MRQKLLLFSLVIIALSIGTTGTWAYFTATKTATNIITMGHVDVALIEKMVDDEGTLTDFADATGVMPGEAVSKIVTVENTGSSDAWVRMEVTKTMTAPDGTGLDTSVMGFTLGEGWMLDDDGYYYYKTALNPTETTSPLWEEIIFDPSMGNDYQSATGTVAVTVYAVQVANNSIPDGGDVSDILGWPSTS